MNKRTLIIMVVTSAIVVTTAGTGLAKGPESATFIGPDIDEPIELINSDPDHFSELLAQTGIWAGTSGPRVSSEPAGDLGPVYTLTWINSGPPGAPIEERTIRQLLYLQAENGPLINTPAQVGLEGWGGDVVGWFMAPEDLIDTLVALGVPVSALPPTGDGQAPDKAAATAQAESAAVPTTESDRDAAISSGAGDIVSVENEPDSFVYLAIIGFGLFVGLVWAARRRASV